MNVFHTTPLLQGDGDNGRKQWQGFAAKAATGQVYIYAKFGTVGGTIQQAKPTEIEAKNIGRANQTSLEQQAIAEIDAKCLGKQKKDNYLPVGVAASPAVLKHQTRILPMLAPSEVYPVLKSDLRFPILAQPKLDGMRLVTDGHDFWSRKGELQNEANIKHLRIDTGGLLLDGEVLLPPDKYSFQESMSAMKNAKHPHIGLLTYCLFDIVDLALPFEERFEILQEFVRNNPHPRMNLVTTIEVADDEDLQDFYEKCLAVGMEGIMLRNKHGKYKPSKRSRDLQKFKPKDDDEFPVVGYREAKGGWAGTPVLELQVTKDNKPGFDGKRGKIGTKFEAKPAMSIEEARALFKRCEAGEVVGKVGATVLFQGFYDQVQGDPNAGKPRFPRVKALRDYE